MVSSNVSTDYFKNDKRIKPLLTDHKRCTEVSKLPASSLPPRATPPTKVLVNLPQSSPQWTLGQSYISTSYSQTRENNGRR